MKWPWVSRTAFEIVQADRDWFRAQFIEAMKPKEPKATVVGRYQTDEQAVRVVEDGFVEKLKAELRAKGVPDAVAGQEAQRIRRETTQYGVAQ